MSIKILAMIVFVFLCVLICTSMAAIIPELKIRSEVKNTTNVIEDHVDMYHRIYSKDNSNIHQETTSHNTELEARAGGMQQQNFGRKKQQKKSPMQSLLPMFIVPFLVQSAIIPVMLSMLKFMLLASFTVGKLALILSAANALKNANRSEPEKMVYAHSGHWR